MHGASSVSSFGLPIVPDETQEWREVTPIHQFDRASTAVKSRKLSALISSEEDEEREASRAEKRATPVHKPCQNPLLAALRPQRQSHERRRR